MEQSETGSLDATAPRSNRLRKLTDDQIRAVREWHQQRRSLGTFQSKAEELGVSQALIERICLDPEYRSDAQPNGDRFASSKAQRSAAVRSHAWTIPTPDEEFALLSARVRIGRAADGHLSRLATDRPISVSGEHLDLMRAHARWCLELGIVVRPDGSVWFQTFPLRSA